MKALEAMETYLGKFNDVVLNGFKQTEVRDERKKESQAGSGVSRLRAESRGSLRRLPHPQKDVARSRMSGAQE